MVQVADLASCGAAAGWARPARRIPRISPTDEARSAVSWGTHESLLVSAAVASDAAARDVEPRMYPFTCTAPMRKADYLEGRFLAALAFTAGNFPSHPPRTHGFLLYLALSCIMLLCRLDSLLALRAA